MPTNLEKPTFVLQRPHTPIKRKQTKNQIENKKSNQSKKL